MWALGGHVLQQLPRAQWRKGQGSEGWWNVSSVRAATSWPTCCLC